jgi:hypothetical protein
MWRHICGKGWLPFDSGPEGLRPLPPFASGWIRSNLQTSVYAQISNQQFSIPCKACIPAKLSCTLTLPEVAVTSSRDFTHCTGHKSVTLPVIHPTGVQTNLAHQEDPVIVLGFSLRTASFCVRSVLCAAHLTADTGVRETA